MNLDRGCLIDAQHLVVIEIALLDAAVLQRDLAMERCRNAKDDRALDLCLDGIGVDDGAAIDRADDAPDTDRPVLRHFNFGDQRQVGREDELEGHATPDSFGERLSPAGPFRGEHQDRFGTGCFIKESQPVRHGILFCGGREFVHKAFDDEDGVRGPTLRQKAVGMPGGSTRTYSTCMFGRL
jgi:hypothetical protein